jgi:hypothetical protein
MGYASIAGRAKTNAKSPEAHAICDRCGFRYNFNHLRWQYDWRGPTLANLKVLVCERCLDRHAEQLRTIVLPPDPMPVPNARPENYVADETDDMSLTPSTTDPTTGLPIPNATTMTTVAGNNMTRQPVGKRRGLTQSAVMPLQEGVTYRVPINLLSLTSAGSNVVTATTSSAHGLSTGNQVSIEGTGNSVASGLFTITVTTGTAFTYETNSVIPAGSVLTGTTLAITAIAGVPYNYPQVPLTGPTVS